MDKSSIEELMRKNARHTAQGVVASYIPELKKQDPSLLGLCLMDTDGQTLSFGDDRSRFTVQSIVKVPVLLAALLDNSLERLFHKAGSRTVSYTVLRRETLFSRKGQEILFTMSQ